MKSHIMSVFVASVITSIFFACGLQTCTKFETIEMALIPGGEFMMGEGEGAMSRVKVSPFYIGVYEVTQKQYEAVTGENPSRFGGKGDNPVEMVDWYNAVLFCNMLSEKTGYRSYYNIDKTTRDPENKNGYDKKGWSVTINAGANGFRLPTSAEWEYACRAGTTTTYYWGESKEFTIVTQYAVYEKNSEKKEKGHKDYGTHRTGTKKANAWGLFDMAGNVNEWCFDWHPRYPGIYRVSRGGSWVDFVGEMSVLESGKVNWFYPINDYDFSGLRLARSM